MEVVDINIEAIAIVDNVRISVRDAALVELMQSIKQNGLLQPIGVTETKIEGKYNIIYGHRRLMACSKLGWVVIPAVVEKVKDVSDHLINNMTENMQRKDNTPLEVGRLCDRMIRDLKMTPEEIAARLAVSVNRIKAALIVYQQVPRDLRDKVSYMRTGELKKGRIPVTTVQKIANMTRSHGIPKRFSRILLERGTQERFSSGDLDIMARMLSAGVPDSKLFQEMSKLKIVNIKIIAYKDEIQELQSKYKGSANTVILKALYGEIKPITKPEFVSINLK